ncbi:MAG: geranylgeranyl reductase family protein [Acidobacteriaceae bacterium]
MLHDHDILIVGAGPAGCAAAYDLARAGKRVLLLDKRNFPRHKACACGLTRKTLKALRYSVDPIVERVCHEIVLQQTSSDPSLKAIRVKTRNPICAMAVRERFDAFCLEQTLGSARKGGSVSLRKIERIAALRETLSHVELDIVTTDGVETLTAPILIGADGSNGQVRRLSAHSLSSSAQDENGFALEATIPYTQLPANLPAGDKPHDLVFDFAPLPGGYGWLFPKGDHINIGVGAFAPSSTSSAQLKQVTRALLLDYAQQKLGVTSLDHITGQRLGMGGHTYIPRGLVLLVGDAAGLVDPLTGEGIHSAIVSGQAAAAAVLSQNKSRQDVAAAYAHHLRPLQETLTFSHRAARAFYAQPERGFKAMRIPILRSLILKTYADGLPHTKLLTTLARLTT